MIFDVSGSFARWLREVLLGPAYFWHKFLISRSKQVGGMLEYATSLPKSKGFYIKNLRENTTLPYFPICKKVSTGGSTGDPFVFFMDTLFRRQKERAYIFDVWSDVGYKPFDLRVIYRGNVGGQLKNYSLIENAWYICPSQLNQETKSQVIELLLRLPDFYIHCYPSSFFSLFNLLGWEYVEKFKIKGILAGSEAFPKDQMAWIESKYRIPIAHWYGHSEYAIFAKYCSVCDGFHFYPSYGRAELFHDSGSGYCKIVATSYNFLGTKFENYDTGDLAMPSTTDCSASSMPRVDSLVGREQEYFLGKDSESYAFGPFLFGIHNRFWEMIVNIQFIQRRMGEIEVYVVESEAMERYWFEELILSRFSMLEVSFEYVNMIPTSKLGKRQYFRSFVD